MRRENAAQLTMGFPLPEGATASPLAWVAVERHLDGRNIAWRCAHYAGVTIWSNAHTRALRPYYIAGLPIEEKYSTLLQAQIAVETHHRAT